MSQSNLSNPLTATDVRDRLRSAGHDVEMGHVLQLAKSGEVKAEKVGGAWMFDGLDLDPDHFAELIGDLNAPSAGRSSGGSLSDRLDRAQEQGREQGGCESGGGDLNGLQSGSDLDALR